MTAIRVLAAAIAALLLGSATAAAQSRWTPPPEPAVRPELPATADADSDGNRLDDRLEARLVAARRAGSAGDTRVELVFTRQVTQAEIDAFAALGGEIDHLYRAVSYGWNGRLPQDAVERLPAALGSALLLVDGERAAAPTLDEATRTGRVRPVWAAGFAGSPGGFSGDASITIAILDTGVDDSHPDLAGRLEYWQDYTADGEPTAIDFGEHGTHVAGIALGSGAAFGAATGTLTYTDSGHLGGFPSDTFLPSSLHLPATPLTVTSTASWLGGGSATLHFAGRTDGATGPFSSLGSSSGSSPIVHVFSDTPVAGLHHSAALLQNGSGSIAQYAVVNEVASYPGAGDGFNTLRGVAAGSRWAGAKVFTNAGTGSTLDIHAAMDDLVAQRVVHDIKVANLSLGVIGNPGIDTTGRAKANTMVDNGIVVAVAAGNDGPGTSGFNLVDDPGRAARVLTVAAGNDVNQVTSYTSSGFLSPAGSEDLKPDVVAPGGSTSYSKILSVDSNHADAGDTGFADQVADDYLNIQGTSMATPFAAGAAALVIDALQQAGTVWDFGSAQHALLVKMLLCASATETNAGREVGSGSDPTLGRAATPKDRFEGYGLINPDAAIEAVSLAWDGAPLGDSSAGGPHDRRAWGRQIDLLPTTVVDLTLAVDATADYDLYLYSGTPDAKGNPVILASSTNPGLDADESLSFVARATDTAYLFVKRVAGSGAWSLSGSVVTTCSDGVIDAGEECDDGNTASGDGCSLCEVDTCHVCTGAPSACTDDPFTGCQLPFVGARASLLVKDNANDNGDRLVWKWVRGTSTPKSLFGDPLATQDYELCVYDQIGAGDELLLEHRVPAGGGNWTEFTKGFRYRDSSKAHDGVLRLLLKEGTDGTAKIIVKTKGPNAGIAAAALPLAQDPTVRVQLRKRGTGTCWEAAYSSFIRNDAEQFKARADP